MPAPHTPSNRGAQWRDAGIVPDRCEDEYREKSLCDYGMVSHVVHLI